MHWKGPSSTPARETQPALTSFSDYLLSLTKQQLFNAVDSLNLVDPRRNGGKGLPSFSFDNMISVTNEFLNDTTQCRNGQRRSLQDYHKLLAKQAEKELTKEPDE